MCLRSCSGSESQSTKHKTFKEDVIDEGEGLCKLPIPLVEIERIFTIIIKGKRVCPKNVVVETTSFTELLNFLKEEKEMVEVDEEIDEKRRWRPRI